jgi:hypothetical protein
LCSHQALYNSNAIPPGFTLRGIFAPGADRSSQGQQQTSNPTLFKPIIINTSALNVQQNEVYIPNGLEIIPWKPSGAALALQVFAASMEQQNTEDQEQQDTHQSSEITSVKGFEFEENPPRSNPIKYVYKRRPKPNPITPVEDGTVSSMESGPGDFEFQSVQIRPSPSMTGGRKANMAKQKRKNMSLPSTVSNADTRTPLVEDSVRRSTRLNKDGFCSVRLKGNPSKKRNNWTIQIDEATGEAGPIAIAVLQGWGIDCGVTPSELTDDALLQAPSTRVPDDSNNN